MKETKQKKVEDQKDWSESGIEEDMGPEDMSFELKDPNAFLNEEEGEEEMEEAEDEMEEKIK
jgi:hypothetical protein